MKRDNQRESDNLEDRRQAPPGSDPVIDGLSLMALGVNAMARSVGIESDADALRRDLNQAQYDIEIAMAALRGLDGPAAAMAGLREQAQALVQMQRSLTDSGGNPSPALKQAIATTIASSGVAVSQSREAALASEGGKVTLAAATEAARRQVQDLSRDIYDHRIFDPYLHFASAEEEAEYRRREAENKRYIDAELAKGTPEGALNASGGMQDQMLDTAAHGADQSPEFKERWEELRKTARQQREAIRAAGGSTEEYDKRIEESVRRFLRSKGLIEAEIDAKIAAAGDDPLAAAEPYMEADKDAHVLNEDLGRAVGPASPSDAQADTDLKQAIRSLRATGTTLSEEACTSGPEHGLAGNGCAQGQAHAGR